MVPIHCNCQHGGCACRALKMLDLRQLVNLKFGRGPFEEGPLHCVPTYLTILRAKVKKQNKTVSNCFEGWLQTMVMT